MTLAAATIDLVIGADRLALRSHAVEVAASWGPGTLVVACGRTGRDDIELALLGPGEAPAVMSPFGWALRIVSALGDPPTVLTGPQQRAEVARLLPGASRAEVQQVAAALLDMQAAFAGPEEVRTHAGAWADHGVAGRWLEVADLAERYQDRLRAEHLVDGTGLLVQAAVAMRQADAVERHWQRFPVLVVVDADQATRPVQRLITSLLGPSCAAGAVALLTGDPAGSGPGSAWLAELPRRVGATLTTLPSSGPEGGAEMMLVRGGHPSMEAEVIVGAVIDAHAKGIAWGEQAVISPGGRERLRAIARAARRAGVPIAGAPPPKLEGPVVDAVAAFAEAADSGVDLGVLTAAAAGSPLRELDDFTVGSTISLLRALSDPFDMVSLVVRRHLPDLASQGGDVTEVVLGLLRHARQFPGEVPGWLEDLGRSPVAPIPPLPAPADAVTLATIDEAVGRRWRHVVLAGAVEGELPRRRPRRPLDPALLDGPVDDDVLRHRWLESERARFHDAVHASAERFTAVAAPEPGVLVSRFVEGLEPAARSLPPRHPDPLRWPPGLAPTISDRPMHPGPGLRLSATQMSAFENCPWQYTVEYRLGVRRPGGLPARFGSLVHEILERFLSLEPTEPTEIAELPENAEPTEPTEPAKVSPPVPRTLDGLLHLAAETWRDDIAEYRPQAEDYRRRLDAILRTWWQQEGSALAVSQTVLAVEHEFRIDVGPHSLRGFIDRVDRVGDGIGVVDYKTGTTARTQADTQVDLQLAVYHLAAERDPELNRFGPVRSLMLNFIAVGTSGSLRQQTILPNHAELTEVRINALAERMLAEEQEPAVTANCEYCDLHRLCPLQAPGRAVPVMISAPTKPRKQSKRRR